MTARRHARRAIAIWTDSAADSGAALASPLVGMFRPELAAGSVIVPGTVIGTLEILGQDVDLVAPPEAHGVVTTVAGDGRARIAVDHKGALYAIDPHGALAAATATAAAATTAGGAAGLVFVAPTGGRYYGRPGPGKPAFVTVGDVIGEGHTICMLEVMKTFNRVTYGGAGLPARARIDAILVADEADVEPGTPLVRLEPA